jgi:hypothetical protein
LATVVRATSESSLDKDIERGFSSKDEKRKKERKERGAPTQN